MTYADPMTDSDPVTDAEREFAPRECTVGEILRSSVALVWLVLVGATAVSWYFGSSHAIGGSETAATVLVFSVACFKIRYVGLYFMDLRHAPFGLRMLFETAWIGLGGVVVLTHLLL